MCTFTNRIINRISAGVCINGLIINASNSIQSSPTVLGDLSDDALIARLGRLNNGNVVLDFHKEP